MYSAERLFIRDIRALRQFIAAPTEDSLLSAAGILRRLLLDSNPLIGQANATAGLSIVYKVRKDRDPYLTGRRSPRSHSAFEDVLPLNSAAPLKDVKLKGFLATPVILSDRREFTVRQVIRYVCHVGGAVHKGAPKEEDLPLDAMARAFEIGGMPSALWPITSIARVVTTGCEELFNKLIADGFDWK